MLRVSAAGLLPLLLSACASEPSLPQGGAAGMAAPACEPGAYDHLVGTPLAAVTLPAALPTRIIEPGEMVTQEYVAERLTLELDETGIIVVARCG